MLNQSLAHFAITALDQREHASRHAGLFDGGVDGLGDQFAGPGMGGVALDDNRAACRQRRGGIAAGHRERQREVGRTEHRDRAGRPLDNLEIGPRQRLAVRQRFIVAAIEIVAFFDMGGKQAQLPRGASALAFQTRLGQTGFLRTDLCDGIAPRIDFFGDGVEKSGAFGTGRNAIAAERCLGGLAGGIDMVGRSDGERMGLAMRRRALEAGLALHPLSCDQVFAGQHGRGLLGSSRDFRGLHQV